MPNIILTTYCNRKCPYCFAGEIHHGSSPPESDVRWYMSLENVGKVIAFLSRSKERVFSIIGGEPTLHPQFVDVVRLVVESGFHLKIFSNGLMGKEIIDFLHNMDPGDCKIILNLNHPRITPPKEKEIITNTMRHLADKINPAVTVWDSIDLDYLIQAIRRFNLIPHIRLGLAIPSLGAENQFVPLKKYQGMAEGIVSFVKECDRYDISVGFDCGFIYCMFTREQIGTLAYCNAQFKSVCTPIIDIDPDLSVIHCFALSAFHKSNLSAFSCLDEVIEYFTEKTAPFRPFGGLDRCFGCRLKSRQQCTGGCLAHTVRQFHRKEGRNFYGTKG